MTHEDLRSKARELYKDHTATEIASLLGKSEPTIRRWVKGITKDPSNKYKEVVDELLQVYEQDGVISSSKEAAILGKSGITITKSVKGGIRAQVTEKIGRKDGVFSGKNEIVIHRSVEDKAYDIYRGMMYRCYDSHSPSYFLYGGRGVFVSEEWHDIDAFVKWYVENYVEDWEVDKDLYSGDVKCYSKETCVFLPAKLNIYLGQMGRSYAPATRDEIGYVKHVVILGKRVCIRGSSRDEVEAKMIEQKIKGLITVMNDERVNLSEELLHRYDKICMKVCEKYGISIDQLEHNLNPDPNKGERAIPARAYKWEYEEVDHTKDLSDVAY